MNTDPTPAAPEVHLMPTGQVAIRIGEDTWWVIEPKGRDHAVYELPDDAVRLVPDETNDDALMAYGMKWQAERAAGIPRGSITAAESVTGNYLMNYDPENGDLHALARDIVAEIAGALVALPTDSLDPGGAGTATPPGPVGHVEMPHSGEQTPHSERVETAARDQAIRVIGGAIVPGQWPVEVMAAAATDALTDRPDVLLALLAEREPGPRDTREALTARLERLRAERVETAAQVLHERRHPGYAHVCDRCRDDARAVATVLTPKETR